MLLEDLLKAKPNRELSDCEGWGFCNGPNGLYHQFLGHQLTIPGRAETLQRWFLGNQLTIPQRAAAPTKTKTKVRKRAKEVLGGLELTDCPRHLTGVEKGLEAGQQIPALARLDTLLEELQEVEKKT